MRSPYLRELQLSDVGFTPDSRKHVAAFVKTCRIHTLKLNANTLGPRGVTKIVDALQSSYSLTHLELLANNLAQPPVESSSSSSSEEEQIAMRAARTSTLNMGAMDLRIKALTTRNKQAQRALHNDALRLLHYARPILMFSWWQEQTRETGLLLPLPHPGGQLFWYVFAIVPSD
jgi:hypothetical protein